jgi:UDP-N-acetyl-D-mannosaminuronic acid dehydrogenase
LLREHVGERFQVREDLAAIEQTDVVVVAIGVQAPEGQERVDLGPLERLFDALGPHSAGKLVILRTTVPVGTTAALKIRLEGISGLREGSDFDLVFCPERVVEGQAVEEEVRLPKIVGAFGSRGFRRAKAYLETIGGEVVPVRNPSTAEIVKLTDNSWRQLRFAFSNDLALACESLGLDVLDVLAAANRGYSRNGIPLPSCGVSGYCLTKDPRFLDMSFGEVERTRGFGSVWGAARQSNDYMVRHTYQKALRLAEQYKRSVRPVRAVVAGLAYKEDCDDFRMSHGPELAAMLANDPRFEVTVFDPYLATFHDNPYLSLPGGASGRIRAATSLSESLVDRDLAIFTVPHKEFLLEASNGGLNHLAETTRKPFVVIDGWNIFARNCGSVESGVVYRGLGRD